MLNHHFMLQLRMCFPTRIPVTLHLVFIVSICFLVSMLFLHEFLLTFPSSESSLFFAVPVFAGGPTYFRPQDVSLVSKKSVIFTQIQYFWFCVFVLHLDTSVASAKFCGLNRDSFPGFYHLPQYGLAKYVYIHQKSAPRSEANMVSELECMIEQLKA